MSDSPKFSIFWFRRDLRLHDNHGLYKALKSDKKVQCLFIFDHNILDKLPSKKDARVEFIYDALKTIQAEVEKHGGELWVRHGKPTDVWKDILDKHDLQDIFTNRDYEPYAKERDEEVKKIADKKGVRFNSYKDHVIFESEEVLKDDGDPYVVFTPYKRKWMERLRSRKSGSEYYYFKAFPSADMLDGLRQVNEAEKMMDLKDIGFERTEIEIPDDEVKQKIIKEYAEKRDYPAINGTSRLGIHFRFGTISIRDKAAKALKLSETYLSELVWRDFYSQILDQFPHVVKNAFREKYDRIEWRNNEKEFEAWCEGKTGYPIVDAGMRELNATGYMHNRVRMVTASFLTKHLLIDWRWGEAYFAEKLLDFDLASNNGGWQWAAGSGTDAAPYFRIFNPASQQKKFDKDYAYVKKWVEEWETDDYPDPIVDHKEARERCLATYKEALN